MSQITDTFIYDPEASFYSMSGDRKTLSGGDLLSPVAAAGRNYSPFEFVKTSKPFLYFATGQ